jgi:hypothetical protein
MFVERNLAVGSACFSLRKRWRMMPGKTKNNRKAFRSACLNYVTPPVMRRNQDQISRLARESSTSTETTPGISPEGTSSPVRSRLYRDDSNRRYAILDHDDSDAEVRKPPTSPYVADSCLNILRCSLILPFKPKGDIVKRLATKEESTS